MIKLTWDRFLILAIFLFSVLLQSQCLLGHDMSWLMHAASKLLHGGTYTQDFFETNPPMALYLHIPPVLLASVTQLSPIVAFRLYVFSISIISLIMCSRLLKTLFKAEDQILVSIIMICLAVCYFILPGREFGQREHLAVMLTMPYFLLQANNGDDGRQYRFLVGLLAGIAFAIKPQFMFALILVETYLMMVTQNYKRVFRAETILIATICSIYLLSVFKFAPEYFEVIPYAQNYFAIYFKSAFAWSVIFSSDIILFFMAAVILFSIFRKRLTYPKLGTVLCLVAFGFFLTYIAEPIYLWYHLIPLFSFSLLLFVFAFFDYTLIYAKSIVNKSTYLAIVLLVFYFPITYLFTVCLMMFLDTTFIEKQLIQTVKQNSSPGQKILFLTMNPQLHYPLVDYAQVRSVFRYEFLWPIVTAYHHSLFPDSRKQAELHRQNNFTKQAIISDLIKGDPDLVLIDPHVGWILYRGKYLDFIKFLSDSATFQKQWKNYAYLTNVGYIKIYKRVRHFPKA